MAGRNLTRKQPPNRKVTLALLPCVAGGIYFFGWRSLAVVAVATAVGFLAEWLFCRWRKEPVSEAVFVTSFLFALIMPPTVPWHVVIIGMLVAIVAAKEVFGGFGRNIFNPAMAGRCFVYVCFPIAMTAVWAPNVFDLPGGAKWYGALDRWSTSRMSAQTYQQLRTIYENRDFQIEGDKVEGTVNAYTGATPAGWLKEKQLDVIELEQAGADPERIEQAREVAEAYRPKIVDLLLGNIPGTMGVTSALLILVGGLYLYITKTANRTIILSVVISCAVFSQLLYMLGVRPSNDAIRSLLSGGFLLGAFFMATDPISSAKTFQGRIIYGCIIGVGRVVIQNFSVFNAGFMFALLLANMFAPTIDQLVREHEAAKKRKAVEATGGQAAAEGANP